MNITRQSSARSAPLRHWHALVYDTGGHLTAKSGRADGTQVAELGPGAVVGERALLEDGRRTATLRAVTDCIIATAANIQIDRESLASLAGMHHREDSDGMSRQVDDAAEPTGNVCTAGMVRAASRGGTSDASTARRDHDDQRCL